MNGNGHEKGKGKRPSRLDRIEAALERNHEEFRRDHKQLLTAQVLLTDAQAKSELKIAALASAIGELIRRMPLPPQA